jgi:hypothetical protein
MTTELLVQTVLWFSGVCASGPGRSMVDFAVSGFGHVWMNNQLNASIIWRHQTSDALVQCEWQHSQSIYKDCRLDPVDFRCDVVADVSPPGTSPDQDQHRQLRYIEYTCQLFVMIYHTETSGGRKTTKGRTLWCNASGNTSKLYTRTAVGSGGFSL